MCIHVCMWACACHWAGVKVRGQSEGISFLFPSRSSWRSKKLSNWVVIIFTSWANSLGPRFIYFQLLINTHSCIKQAIKFLCVHKCFNYDFYISTFAKFLLNHCTTQSLLLPTHQFIKRTYTIVYNFKMLSGSHERKSGKHEDNRNRDTLSM